MTIDYTVTTLQEIRDFVAGHGGLNTALDALAGVFITRQPHWLSESIPMRG
jgi:hypothetical protein